MGEVPLQLQGRIKTRDALRRRRHDRVVQARVWVQVQRVAKCCGQNAPRRVLHLPKLLQQEFGVELPRLHWNLLRHRVRQQMNDIPQRLGDLADRERHRRIERARATGGGEAERGQLLRVERRALEDDPVRIRWQSLAQRVDGRGRKVANDAGVGTGRGHRRSWRHLGRRRRPGRRKTVAHAIIHRLVHAVDVVELDVSAEVARVGELIAEAQSAFAAREQDAAERAAIDRNASRPDIQLEARAEKTFLPMKRERHLGTHVIHRAADRAGEIQICRIVQVTNEQPARQSAQRRDVHVLQRHAEAVEIELRLQVALLVAAQAHRQIIHLAREARSPRVDRHLVRQVHAAADRHDKVHEIEKPRLIRCGNQRQRRILERQPRLAQIHRQRVLHQI